MLVHLLDWIVYSSSLLREIEVTLSPINHRTLGQCVQLFFSSRRSIRLSWFDEYLTARANPLMQQGAIESHLQK
jgi:hypothetical protein